MSENMNVNKFITFDEAREIMIVNLEKKIEEDKEEIQSLCKSSINYSTQNLNLVFGIKLDKMNGCYENMKRLFETIRILKELNYISVMGREREVIDGELTDKITMKSIIFVKSKEYKNINIKMDNSDEEFEVIKKQVSSVEDTHWTNTQKVTYESMELLANAIIKKNKKKFQILLGTMSGNKSLAENFTRFFYGTASKHL